MSIPDTAPTLAARMQAVYVEHYAEWGQAGDRMVIYVGEDDLDAWIAEARALQAEVAAGAAVLAAAEAYGAACRGVEAAYASAADGWGDRMADATQARQDASDALLAAVDAARGA